MTPAFWRKWHRWIGAVAGLFLLFAGTTGVIVAMTEFFGEEEALREAMRGTVSSVTTATADRWQTPIPLALSVAAREAPNAPVDKVVLHFKKPVPTVDVFLGGPAGGEDRRLVIEAATGKLLAVEPYADKPLIHRIHSGEFFGDGGLVFAMLWGTALVGLSLSGLWIYLTMRRRNATGLGKVFW
jgi:uncharacterized iron-regulated membrane protein